MVSEPPQASSAWDQGLPNLAEHQNHPENLKNERSWSLSRDLAAVGLGGAHGGL